MDECGAGTQRSSAPFCWAEKSSELRYPSKKSNDYLGEERAENPTAIVHFCAS